MFRLETAGIRFLHIGDNYIDWSEEIKRAAGKIDVLMLTVDDSCHLLSYSEVDTMIAMVKPRVVVPMHYRIPGLMPETTTLKSIDGWLATRSDVRYLKSHRIALSEECLPPSPEVWVFDPSPEVFTAASMPPSIHGE
jgi:L-ascorbate metabolism protein UlaG (beta-lactamase superfamily)